MLQIKKFDTSVKPRYRGKKCELVKDDGFSVVVRFEGQEGYVAAFHEQILDYELPLLMECSDFEVLKGNLSEIELLVLESVLERCTLRDKREDGEELENAYEQFEAEVPEGYGYNSEEVLPLLMWYSSFEYTDYLIDRVHHLVQRDVDTLEDVVRQAVFNGLFVIGRAEATSGCQGIICKWRYGHMENEFYFAQTDDFEGTPEHYIVTEGLEKIVREIAGTIREMAGDEVDCLEAEDYLNSMNFPISKINDAINA